MANIEKIDWEQVSNTNPFSQYPLVRLLNYGAKMVLQTYEELEKNPSEVQYFYIAFAQKLDSELRFLSSKEVIIAFYILNHPIFINMEDLASDSKDVKRRTNKVVE